MKKIFLTTVILCVAFITANAQKFGYVNTEYILERVPEFGKAQSQLNDLSAQWQKEVEAKFVEIDKLYRKFQNDAVLLPDDIRKKREEEIINKEREAKDLQKKRFGQDGDLFKKRQEIIKPIQDKVYKAIEEIAKFENYAIIFDKASNSNIVFTDARIDISDDVLKKLGYRK